MSPDPREGASRPQGPRRRPSRRWVAGALVVGIVAYVADRPDEQAAGSDPLTSG